MKRYFTVSMIALALLVGVGAAAVALNDSVYAQDKKPPPPDENVGQGGGSKK